MQPLTNYDLWHATKPGKAMKRIRVFIIDEHLAVRQALAARLGSFIQIEVVGTASNFREGLEQAGNLQPEVILLELKGSSNREADPVGEMCQALAGHPVGIIVLTSYADDVERAAALDSGARRYLLKHIDSTRLLAEIEAVALEVDDEAGQADMGKKQA